MIAPLLSIVLGAGCLLLPIAASGRLWPMWLVTTSASTFVLGMVWPRRWMVLAALLLVTQPIALYVLKLTSGEIAHPTHSTGGMVAVAIASFSMFVWAPIALFTGWIGAWLGRSGRADSANAPGPDAQAR